MTFSKSPCALPLRTRSANCPGSGSVTARSTSPLCFVNRQWCASDAVLYFECSKAYLVSSRREKYKVKNHKGGRFTDFGMF
ncbi:hypothetical protein DPMN_121060 [Dreissena polymorpha]|uniref:Uncharacterized protein n=1 Tax=Dreissena polymorpha TaxID=45954 RepID=A0A9D4GM27_DREPO|nr:hypothetical protein DPMN_121060 [Dreissena polymorpha]